MIYLTTSYKRSVQEADGLLHASGLGYMQTPQSGVRVDMLRRLNAVWGADNGCYAQGDSFNFDSYLRWLEAMRPVQGRCLFATAPDVVGNAQATWERSKDALPLIRQMGYKAAFVGQDGLENMDIEWDTFDCLFIGGTTEWKLSINSRTLVRRAKARRKWVHVGRVNSRNRLIMVSAWGADSADGTYARYRPDLYIRHIKNWLDEVHYQASMELSA